MDRPKLNYLLAQLSCWSMASSPHSPARPRHMATRKLAGCLPTSTQPKPSLRAKILQISLELSQWYPREEIRAAWSHENMSHRKRMQHPFLYRPHVHRAINTSCIKSIFAWKTIQHPASIAITIILLCHFTLHLLMKNTCFHKQKYFHSTAVNAALFH